MQNRRAGTCNRCRKPVAAQAGTLERIGGRRHGTWIVWCQECFGKSDRSGQEACGDRAYEDQCAAQCGPGL